MHSIYFFLLQSQVKLQSDFVMRAGLLVVILCGFIIYLSILYRHKKNSVYLEKKLQEQRFNEELLRSRVEVQEATFTTVGKELHDNVGQLISTALMLINITERNLTDVPPTLLSASVTLNKSILELRSISKSLNKEWLEQFELYHNLQTELSRINTSAALVITLQEMDENIPFTPEQQFILFRIVQEAIQNVVRHSGATKLDISIKKVGQQIITELRDNGHGFNTRLKTTGVGIPNMRQRAQSLGGSVKWESRSTGTTIHISLPLKLSSHGL